MREQAEHNLAAHAGFTPSDPAGEAPRMADLYRQFKRNRDIGKIEEASSDVIRTISAINEDLNFAPASSELESTPLARRVTAAVTQICVDCSEMAILAIDSEARGRAKLACWKILCAWNAVTAGDIEDIGAHVEMEARARFPKPTKK